MGAADHSEPGDDFDAVTIPSAPAAKVDRSHNRDTLSSEAMTEMLRDVQDTMLALDERLSALESAHGQASGDTRRLARGVVDMGDALTRRVRALEQRKQDLPSIVVRREAAAPAPIKRPRPPPQRRLFWTTALVFMLAAVLGAFWLLSGEPLDHATALAAFKPAVIAAVPPPAPAAVDDTLPLTPPVAPPVVVQTAPHAVTAHRWTPAHRTFVHAARASTSPMPPIGYSHYGPSQPAAAPGPAQP